VRKAEAAAPDEETITSPIKAERAHCMTPPGPKPSFGFLLDLESDAPTSTMRRHPTRVTSSLAGPMSYSEGRDSTTR
jgi:hypothetical protein